MRNSVDVLVIGGGVVGAAAARALAARGVRVLVVCRGAGIGEATPAAAGMLAAQVEAHDDGLLPLALAARDRHAALAGELTEAGHPVQHRADGILQVALTDAEADAHRSLMRAHTERGLRAEWIDAGDLAREVPGIAPAARGALHTPDDGQVDNVLLGKALMRDAVQRRGMMEFAAADQLLVDQGRIRGAHTSAGDRLAPVVILAAGAWSPRLTGLPRPLPIEPVRGQMTRTAWPDGLPRRIIFGEAGYIVPRGDDALLGTTMERAGFDTKTTAEGQAAIRAAVTAVVPSVAQLPALEAWSGLRPMTPDGRPIIGRDPDLEGLVYATGHGRNGILLGPLSGELAAQLALGEKPSFDVSPYGIERFMPSSDDPTIRPSD